MSALDELERLAQAAAEPHVGDHSGMYEPCDTCFANQDLMRALSPQRVLQLVAVVRATSKQVAAEREFHALSGTHDGEVFCKVRDLLFTARTNVRAALAALETTNG